MGRIGGVGGQGGQVPEGFDAGQAAEASELAAGPETVAAAQRPARGGGPGEDFTKWRTDRAVIAADGGPAVDTGFFRPREAGTVRIHRGDVSFVRRVAGTQDEPPRPLSDRERRELVATLKRELREGTPQAAELRYVLAQLQTQAKT